MEHQDWAPLIFKKTEHKHQPVMGKGKKQKELDSDDPTAPQTLGLSAGKQIQQARTNKKMTQKQLAQMLNLKVQVINEYESGKAIPQGSIINKLNRILGIKIVK